MEGSSHVCFVGNFDLYFSARQHAGCRINDAAAKVLTAEVRQPSAVKITAGQQGLRHAGQGKSSPG